MQSLLNKHKGVLCALFLGLMPGLIFATEYEAIVDNVAIELQKEQYFLNADVQYRLSPMAKEALNKGISLSWVIKINVKKKSLLWDWTIKQQQIEYQIKNLELLNLYSVKNLSSGDTNMFSTLTAAFNSVSKIRQIKLLDSRDIDENETYYIAIQLMFDREALPVPLRPMSYFDLQWALSSPWTLWPLEN